MELINNPNFIYSYKSPVGLFFIRYNPSVGKWELGIEDDVFGYYTTTIAAADDVYTQSTDCYEWDMLNLDTIINIAPTDIYEWKRTPYNEFDYQGDE